MSAAYVQQATFDRGELSPLLLSRADIDYWRSSTSLCTNFLVLRQGGLRRRSGTIFIREVKNSAERVRLLPFVFSASQAYVLEMGDSYTRCFADRAVLGVPYEIASPYAESELFDLQYVQSADKMYIAHGSHAPRELQRSGDTNWAYAEVDFRDGPFLDEIAPTRITLSATGHATPDMTGNTNPSGTASAQYNNSIAWKAFNRDNTNEYHTGATGRVPFWVKYDFGASNEKVIAYYSIQCTDGDPSTDMATAWELQARTTMRTGTFWTSGSRRMHGGRTRSGASNSPTCRPIDITGST